MREFGFKSPEGLLFPKPIESAPDVYTVTEDTKGDWMRFLVRYQRARFGKLSLSEDLQGPRLGEIGYWEDDWKKHQ